jgi:hypothetical protein
MFTFVPGDIEATRRYLAALGKKDAGGYLLMKWQEILNAEDRRIFTCDLHEVAALVAIDEKRHYEFSIHIFGLPGTADGLKGLDEVVRAVEVPPAYHTEVNLPRKPRSDGSFAVTAAFHPKKSISIDDALAFEFHTQAFCDYSGRALTELIESRVEWRVPEKQFYFLSGQLPVFDPNSRAQKK